MTDDIVTRLREYNPIKGFIDWHDTMTTAADEIERLRQDPNKVINGNWLAELLEGTISNFTFDALSGVVDIRFKLSSEQTKTLWEAVQAGQATHGDR